MRKTYKILSVILAVLMIFSIMPITASAETITGTCGANITWVYDSVNHVLTISGTGDMYDYNNKISPWKSGGYWISHVIIDDGVTSIGESAFENQIFLFKVTIGDSVIKIKDFAFDGCTYLNTVIMGNSVKSIGEYAFRHCPFGRMEIPDSAVTIGNYAFFRCESLSELIIGKNVTTIGAMAFEQCTSLKNITIPDSVTKINVRAFYNCSNISVVNMGKSVTEIALKAFGLCDSITDVYYNSTETAWNKIIVGDVNECLLNATIHFVDCTHKYNEVIVSPTCTEQGYTTYTCECGDTYVDDYINALGHTPASAVEENYVAPTCTENGSKDVMVYCSVCDEEISRETVTLEAIGHADNDGDGYCDKDNELLDPTVECECNCHKSGITKFFFNFVLFFQKLFGLNKTCACGIAHY